jgi:integrase/recombinase XerC
MRFDVAIEAYLVEMRAEGRITSVHTEASYRSRLNVLGAQVANRSPHTVGVGDIERTLATWPNPATSQHARSVYVSFCDWCQHKRLMKTNPARGTRPRRVKAPNVYRLSRSEVVALFAACEDRRETRAIRIGCLAGLRNAELCGLQLRHFKRPGAIWVSPDVAKGARQRFIPVLAELQEVVADIHATVGEDDYVIAGRRPLGGNAQTTWREVPTLPSSPHALRALVDRVARRAGIAAHIHPHLLRHAFGDHVARQAGLRAAQATLGHASSATTSGTYTGAPTLDELTAALAFFRYDEAPSPSEVPR